MTLDTKGDSPQAPRLSQRTRIAIGLLVLTYIVIEFVGDPRPSADLLPLWLAGQAFADGAFDQIYAPVEAFYRMLPPESWADRARAMGYEGFLFPFVYPPLWAWIFGALTEITGFHIVAAIATVLNLVLLVGICLLARRASGAALGAFAYVVIGQFLLHGTAVGKVAVYQNQAQILVAFLVVLALERARADRPVIAGTALALAASIKLFPAVFALLWLASGERRAVAAFAVVGAALGLASLAVAGWPLHAEFLGHVAAIGNTGFFSPLSFSLDGLISGALIDERIPVPLGHTTPDPEMVIWVAPKPPAIALAGKLALAGLIVGFALAMARAGKAERYGALWPAALVLFPLIGPLAWGYYYISATAFAPALISRFGPWAGGGLLFAVYAPIHYELVRLAPRLATVFDFQPLGVGVMLLLATAFLVSARGLRERA